jgi:DNA-binding transcriptional ArsR family regulator
MPKPKAETAAAQKSKAQKEQEDLDAIFGALAHPSRRQILLMLLFRGGQMTAGQIAERFSCSWPTSSRHLRVLVAAGLIRVEKRGRARVYCLDKQKLKAVVGDWMNWFDEKAVE